MIHKFSLALLLATVSPATVFAMGSDDSSVEKPEREKMVCKRETATGSIMSRRTCRSSADQKALEEKGKADLDRVRAMERSRSLVNDNR